MKKLQLQLTAVLLAAGCAALTGCAKPGGGDASAEQKLGGSFTTDMTMTIDDMTANGTLARMGEGVWRVSFDEPPTLAGIVLDFADGDVTASYKGLAFSVPQSAMPAKSVLSNLILAVDELAQQEKIAGEEDGDSVVVTGEMEGNPYILTLTKNGDLAGFEMDNMDAVLNFSGFQSGGTPVATETTGMAESGT